MNEFSLLCRMLGNLFSRSPDSPILAPLMNLIATGKLAQHWPLDQDDILNGLQKEKSLQALVNDYQQLFNPVDALVSPYAYDWLPSITEQQVVDFLSIRGRTVALHDACHIGQLLLSASWLEDNCAVDESGAQLELFEVFLLPWCGNFLGKMESCANTEFYRSLARLARGAIQAMYDELIETGSEKA